MDDLKREDGQSHLDIIHDDNVRQGSTKRKLLDQVYKVTMAQSRVRCYCSTVEQTGTTKNEDRLL